MSSEQNKPYYQIKDDEKKELTDKKQIIIKVKNIISSILYNYKELEKKDFIEEHLNKTDNIFWDLRMIMKSSNILIDGNLPPEWYIYTLLETLRQLPLEYQENDYKKLLNELKNELTDSIKQNIFEDIIALIGKVKYAKINKKNSDKIKEIITEIRLNNIVNDIIENEILNSTIDYKVSNNKKEISFNKENLKKEQLEVLNEYFFIFNKKGFCKTIEEFVKKFPNLNENLPLEGKEINEKEIATFEMQKQMKLPENLKIFFNYVNELVKIRATNEKDADIISNKIYDYVMSKIYSRIYPKEKHLYDKQIYEKICNESWMKPEYFNKLDIKLNFDLVILDTEDFFKLMREAKSPNKKYNYFQKTMDIFRNFLIFANNEQEFHNLLLPFLSFCIIKFKPTSIYTDCKFMELYMDEKKKIENEYLINYMIEACNFIKDLELKPFNDDKPPKEFLTELID
jgi:hypothetical protein